MGRLFLIEGIPGSGKTTYALRLEKHFNEGNMDAKCYLEGDAHPADLAWCAVLNTSEYNSLLFDYPAYAARIREISFNEGNNVILPYINLGITGEDKELWDYLESREIFNGRRSIKDFMDINESRWRSFAKKNSNGYERIIFESVFFQNHVNEILLFHGNGRELINDYIKRLRSSVSGLEPVLIYLDQENIEKTIKTVAEKRKSNKPGFPDWIDRVVEYTEESPFGQKCSTGGLDCFLDFLNERRSVELSLFNELPGPKLIIRNSAEDYERCYKEVLEFVSSC